MNVSHRAGRRTFQLRAHQAVALRRRRLRDPLVAGDDPLELARRALRHRRRLRRAQRARPGRRHRHHGARRNQHAGRTSRHCSPRFAAHGNFGLVALVGVQSNQYPRALDIARPFREAGMPVAMGGFHVSGCLSMLDGRAVELDACRELGIAMFAGEAEGRLDARAAATPRAGELAPLYNFMKDLPGIGGHAGAVPAARRYVERTLGAQHELRRRPRLSRTSARSAPSSTCRDASRAIARPTTWSGWCG